MSLLTNLNTIDLMIIVKFTRRDVRNKFYSNRKNLTSKKVKELPDLNLHSDDNVYVSEFLTPYKKKLFGNANKLTKRLKWKFIWTNNGRIYIKEKENTSVFTFNTQEDLNKFENTRHR